MTKQLTLYDLNIAKPKATRRPTRLKRHNCHFDAIDCTDLPYLLATAIVDNLYPHRHEMLALRSTCKTLRGAIDDCEVWWSRYLGSKWSSKSKWPTLVHEEIWCMRFHPYKKSIKKTSCTKKEESTPT